MGVYTYNDIGGHNKAKHWGCPDTVDTNGLTSMVQVSGQWSVADKPYGISVSVDGHVIISFSETSTVGVFTHAGVLQRRIAVDPAVVNLRHAVLLATGQLVICHGAVQQRAAVSIVDADGHLVKTLAADDRQLVWPTHVAVDERGFIYASDYSGKRVAQLDRDLAYVADIVGYDDGLRNPRNIGLDSIRRRLYVAQAAGSVIVFGLQNLLPLY